MTVLLVTMLLVVGAARVWPGSEGERPRLAPEPAPRAGRIFGRRRRRRPTKPSEVEPQQAAAAALLIAACLEAGATPAAALRQAAAAGESGVGVTLMAAAEEVEDSGIRPPALAGDPWRPIGAVFGRSLLSGAAMSGQLVEAAGQLRDETHFIRLERARRVGVLSTLPLGLCLLPAFVLLAVVPAVLGLSTTL